MAVSNEVFAEYLTGADYIGEVEDRPVLMMAKMKAKTGERAGENLTRFFIPIGEAWVAESSGLLTFRCYRLDEETGEFEFRTYNVGRFQTLPVEVPTVEA